MMHQTDFTKPNPLPQNERTRPTPGHPITRPAGPDDFCFECGAQIGGDVTEFAVSHSEIHFICEFCSLDTRRPIPFVLAEGVSR